MRHSFHPPTSVFLGLTIFLLLLSLATPSIPHVLALNFTDSDGDGNTDYLDLSSFIAHFANLFTFNHIYINYGVQIPTPTPLASDPTLTAAGDIVCDGMTPTSSSCQQLSVSQTILDQHPSVVLTLGDNCHTPTAECYNTYFNQSWGRFKTILYPIAGNHEYLVSHALNYFDYFNGLGVINGQAGNRGQGYYSFNLGSWRLIALNSQCSEAGGCNSGSPQYTWLENDLKTNSPLCTLAYYHIPLFSSGGRANNNMLQIYALLYNHGVDLVLDGHDHIYERFSPQNPSGQLDTTQGIREFIVGTGGANHTSLAAIQPNSEVRNVDTFGVLKLTLHPQSYDWQFLPVAGKTFTDSGSNLCH
jgi:hypothetical protein